MKMNLCIKQKDSQTQKTYGYQRAKGGQERDTLGVWDQQIQTTTHKTYVLYNTGIYSIL